MAFFEKNKIMKPSKNNDSHAVKYQGVNTLFLTAFLKELSLTAEQIKVVENDKNAVKRESVTFEQVAMLFLV